MSIDSVTFSLLSKYRHVKKKLFCKPVKSIDHHPKLLTLNDQEFGRFCLMNPGTVKVEIHRRINISLWSGLFMGAAGATVITGFTIIFVVAAGMM